MSKHIVKTALLIFFLSAPFFTTKSLAVGMGMGMGMGPPTPCGGPFPPCPVPLDSGIMFLLFAGIAYGAYKIYNSFQKNPA